MGAAATFRATLLQGGKTATGIEVPEDAVTALGTGRRPAVCATVNGYTYRTSVASMGGRFMLPVSAAVRAEAGLAAGDQVEVALVPDTEPRVVDVPADFAAALDAAPTAKAAFEALSYSSKRRYVLTIEGAKAEETRRRRITKTVAELGTPA